MPSEVTHSQLPTLGEDPAEQRQNEVLFSEVVAVLSDLGHYNRVTKQYQLNQHDYNGCLRDLIRFLRNDGRSFVVRRQMGMSNIVDNDLLPIVEQHTITTDGQCKISEKGKSLLDKSIRLLVDLTNPTLLHYRDQQAPKDDKHEMQIYLHLQSILYEYKQAFATHKRFWIVLSKQLTHILEMEHTDRQMEDELMLERIIILIRNVLHIPIMASSQEIAEETNAHDRIIEHMSNSGLLDIIHFMVNSGEYSQFCFHIIEILFLMFREQNAEFLAKSSNPNNNASQSSTGSRSRSQFESEFDRKEYEEARNRDRQEQLQALAKVKTDDFTRFNGSAFVVKNLKSISDRDMITYRAYSNPKKAMDLDRNKTSQRRARNRRPMIENMDNSDSLGIQRIHRSNRRLREILFEFCCKFLSECYNDFMSEIRGNLSRGNAQDHDETYYLWALQFFMEFSRYRPNATKEDKYRQVYETLSISSFHYLQTLVDDYLDHLAQKKAFKNELGDWSKRLHLVLRCYRELLFSIAYIEQLNLPEATKMCHRIKNDLFTEQEYRELLLRLLQGYNEERMSKAYLRDLIETNHIFLKMLDYHAKISYNFKVKVKKRKRAKPKKKQHPDQQEVGDHQDNQSNTEQSKTVDEPEAPEIIWMDIMEQVTTALHLEIATDGVVDEAILKDLFDPLTDRTLDEQKHAIMCTINQFLRKREVKKSVALFREARNALAGFDDDNVFGEAGIAVEDEMIALNHILMTDFSDDQPSKKLDEMNDEIGKGDVDEQDSDEDDDQAESATQVQEKTFSIEDTLRRYAHPSVIRTYRLLLKNFRTNSPNTNHAIVKMLHRIAVTVKMQPMFYNLGYFILFEQILEDPVLRSSHASAHVEALKELAQFSLFIMRSFFKLLEKYPKIICEICFTANSRDAYAMEYGFEEETVAQMIKQQKGTGWLEEQILELEVLYKEYKDKVTPDKDLVDLIQDHMIDDTKTRRQIIAQLKRMDLIDPKDIRKNAWKGPTWSEDENQELKSLYEKFKDNLGLAQIIENETNENLEGNGQLKPDESDVSRNDDDAENEGESRLTTTIMECTSNESQPNTVEINRVPSKPNKPNDIIDCILMHLSTRDKRNRRQVMRQLKLMNIYDHSAGKRWTKEQIEELRIIFCNLFIDFKQSQQINADTDDKQEENEIIPSDPVDKNNFVPKLIERFSDKSKTNRQIIRQLKKMGFEDDMRSVGILKKSVQRQGEDRTVGDDFGSDGENDASSEAEEFDDDDEFDHAKSSRSRQRFSNEDDVVIQFDDESDHQESSEISKDHSPSIRTDEPSSDERKARIRERRKRLEKMRDSLINKDDDSDGEEDHHTKNDESFIKDKSDSVVPLESSQKKNRRSVFFEDYELDQGGGELSFKKDNPPESLRKFRRLVLDSDDDERATNSNNKVAAGILIDSNDEESGEVDPQENDSIPSNSKPKRVIDSDDEFESESKTMIASQSVIDFDDSDDAHRPRVATKHKLKRLLDSDEEDESTEVASDNTEQVDTNTLNEPHSSKKRKLLILDDDDDDLFIS